jgi:D-arabinose 1-dehydrogenase-like Zn-dependent alcohol dehydrogenase
MLDAGPDELAVVVGAGTLGIIGMWALQAAGARVAVVQRSDARRRLAAELGADAVLEPGADVEAALGSRPRAALVTAPGVEALSWALERVDVDGRVHAFAGIPGGAPIDAKPRALPPPSAGGKHGFHGRGLPTGAGPRRCGGRRAGPTAVANHHAR